MRASRLTDEGLVGRLAAIGHAPGDDAETLLRTSTLTLTAASIATVRVLRHPQAVHEDRRQALHSVGRGEALHRNMLWYRHCPDRYILWSGLDRTTH